VAKSDQDFPKFERTAKGMLRADENELVSDLDLSGGSGSDGDIILAQHVSHGSHGSHGSW